MNIPVKLRQRPRFDGMPIPYVAFVHNDTRVPDFKMVDEYARLLCIERYLCALCGQSIKKKELVVFVGDDKCCANGDFLDPGMHEECVLWAAQENPNLINPMRHSEFTGPPRKFGLYYCRGYDAMAAGDHSIYIKAWRAVKVEWDKIKQPELQEATVDTVAAFVPAVVS